MQLEKYTYISRFMCATKVIVVSLQIPLNCLQRKPFHHHPVLVERRNIIKSCITPRLMNEQKRRQTSYVLWESKTIKPLESGVLQSALVNAAPASVRWQMNLVRAHKTENSPRNSSSTRRVNM